MEIIPFYGIAAESAKSIVWLQLAELSRLARSGNDVELHFPEEAVAALVDIALDRMHGARALRRAVDERVKRPLVDFLLSQGTAVRGRRLFGNWSNDTKRIAFKMMEG